MYKSPVAGLVCLLDCREDRRRVLGEVLDDRVGVVGLRLGSSLCCDLLYLLTQPAKFIAEIPRVALDL